MKNISIFLVLSSFLFLTGCGSKNRYFHDQFLKTDGSRIVGQGGEDVYLCGFNIGSWLLVEPWMLKLDPKTDIRSGDDLFDKLETRFGKKQARDLYQTFMDNFITSEDIAAIADMGLNCIRVPFWYAALTDPKYSERDFYYLDRIIGWARNYHLYVLIDMHGAPGGQNADPEQLGETVSNQLWTDPEKLNQTMQIWKRIAAKYKNERTVAGYDLLNEPTGAPSLPASVKDLFHFYDILYRTIREIDTNHLIFMEDAGQGVERMPNPKTMGWENVVYSFHFYPDTNNMKAYANSCEEILPNLKRAQYYLDVPFHVGEFNSVQTQGGGVAAIKKLIGVFRSYGWSWNFWSYKKIEDRPEYNWALTGYEETQTDIDFNTATVDIIRDLFRQYQTVYLKKNAELETVLRDFSSSLNAPGKLNRIRDDLVLFPEEAILVKNTNGNTVMDWSTPEPVVRGLRGGDSVCWLVKITNEGVYAFNLNVAADPAASNGNFDASVWINGLKYADLSVPLSGNDAPPPAAWLYLSNGFHSIVIESAVTDERPLAFREAELIPTNGVTNFSLPAYGEVRLSPLFFFAFDQTNGDVCVEWENSPGNIGRWRDGEAVTWAFESDADASYRVTLYVSSTNGGNRLMLDANLEERTRQAEVPDTGDLKKYRKTEAGKMKFRKGLNLLTVKAVTRKRGDAVNLSGIRLKRSGE